MALARRVVERAHPACGLRRRRLVCAVAGRGRSARHRGRRAAQADDREHPRAAAPLDERQRAVRRAIHQFLERHTEPKPVQSPCPIWLATNAQRLATAQVDSGGSEFALTRVGRIADGWMTHSVGPHGFKRSWEFILRVGRESGRDMSSFDNVLYHHINVNADKQDALADSKRFLDLYYSADYTQARLESWLTYGSPRECVEQIKGYKASGCRRITFRISTMGDQMAQFRRVIEDVLPYVD